MDVQAICQYVADTLKQAESYDLLVLRSIVEDMTVSFRLCWDPSLTSAGFAAIVWPCNLQRDHSAFYCLLQECQQE